MPQYAQFDSTVVAPCPVLGWLDTDALTYPTMPPDSDLLEMTPDQWANRMTSYFAVNNGALVVYAPPPPILSLSQQAAVALSAGHSITCAATPALNALYATDSITLGLVGNISLYILINSKFPGEAATYPWPDIAGGQHLFPSVATFQAFFTAINDYVCALRIIVASNAGTLPANVTAI